MPNLDAFINSIGSRQKSRSAADPKLSCSAVTFPAKELPNLSVALARSDEHQFFVLVAFEQWIQNHQHSSIIMHKHDTRTCGKIQHLMSKYHSAAREIYAGVPASMSIMYLTLIDLWVMSDRSPCHILPLLKEYDTEISIHQFQCLSLPLRVHMKRLLYVERYVQARQDGAQEDRSPLYRDFGHGMSFAVHYFDQCTDI